MTVTVIDVFAHVLPPKFYQEMLQLEPRLPQMYPFITQPLLSDLVKRQQYFDGQINQVISNVNLNPEDYTTPDKALALCRQGNDELAELVLANQPMFLKAVAMLPLNNISGALELLTTQIAPRKEFCGIQLFTRALGKSIADESFYPVFAKAHELGIPIWLHPIFDERKPDNNIVFSWEYELTQAMYDLVKSELFTKLPQIKIIVHHAGGMVPYFAERIAHILPPKQTSDFKRFYVDTAILGNPKALELAVAYYGADHVLFGTDAPLGIAPAGAGQALLAALDETDLSLEVCEKILHENFEKMIVGDQT